MNIFVHSRRYLDFINLTNKAVLRSRDTMGFTLYSLIEAAILFLNAVAVLHEERFLAKIGWGSDQSIGGFGDEPGMKTQMINFIRSVRTVMRVPLIFVNVLTIVSLLLFG